MSHVTRLGMSKDIKKQKFKIPSIVNPLQCFSGLQSKKGMDGGKGKSLLP